MSKKGVCRLHKPCVLPPSWHHTVVLCVIQPRNCPRLCLQYQQQIALWRLLMDDTTEGVQPAQGARGMGGEWRGGPETLGSLRSRVWTCEATPAREHGDSPEDVRLPGDKMRREIRRGRACSRCSRLHVTTIGSKISGMPWLSIVLPPSSLFLSSFSFTDTVFGGLFFLPSVLQGVKQRPDI